MLGAYKNKQASLIANGTRDEKIRIRFVDLIQSRAGNYLDERLGITHYGEGPRILPKMVHYYLMSHMCRNPVLAEEYRTDFRK